MRVYVSIHVCTCNVGVFYKLYSLKNNWNLVDGLVGNFSISPTQPYKGAKECRRGKSLVFSIYQQSSKLDKDEVSLASDSESEYGFQ